MLSRYDYNELMGIPNHPPCDCCGKENGGICSGSFIGNYKVCSDICYKRLRMRIDNGLIPSNKENQNTEELMRIRIKQLEHKLKSAKKVVNLIK